jgi:hypothetical protein
MLVRSVFPGPDGTPMRELGDYITDDRSPVEQRWGGWYVRGTTGSIRHMGNAIVTDAARPQSMVTDRTLNLKSLKGKFDTDGYLSSYSDIVALMVFEHQMHMVNLFTRVGWEVRLAQYQGRVDKTLRNQGVTDGLLRDMARELVDYMLFVDEASLRDKIQGSGHFGFRRGVLRAGSARQQGTLAAPIRPPTATHALSRQLHDLLTSLRWHARSSQRSSLHANVADSFRRRKEP